MKGKQVLVIIAILLAISFLSAWTFLGIPFIKGMEKSIISNMKLGLDIKGGVSVVYELETDAKGEELKELVNQTKTVVAQRVNSLGLTEPNIYSEGEDRIVLEIPGVSNAKEALDLVGTTAKLEFAQVKDGKWTMHGEMYDPAKMDIIFGGEVVKDSRVVQNKTNLPVVSLSLNPKGAEIFAKATSESVNYINGATGQPHGQIAIMLDRKVLSAPGVGVVISNGECVIEGNFTYEDAHNLSVLIKGGALPATLKEIKTEEIGPTLGMDALYSSVKAALIGTGLVILFMIGYYKLPGLVASISLILYATITMILMVVMNATLTLPGVCGLVLSIGMAVDANVIIFERMKEEMAENKGLIAAMEHGFAKTLSTILDSNITTIIAGAVLFNFGEGSIKGFAVTLMLGVITSMFTAIIITKELLKQFVYSDRFADKQLYKARG